MSDLVIIGVVDGPLSQGTPKAVALRALNDIPDLSLYGIESANNGNASAGAEFTLPSDAASAGDIITIATEEAQYTAFFGEAPSYTSGALAINGDDALVLFRDGEIADVYGVIGTDGTGEAWEYTDAYALRTDTVPSPVFNLATWDIEAPDTLDGATTAPADLSGVFSSGEPGEGGTTPSVTIMDIQGPGHVSPFVLDDGQDDAAFFANLPADTLSIPGDAVQTSGIVTATDTNGFYLQDPVGDGDPATSDAIFVFTGSAPPVAIGDLIELTATVSEFFPGDTDTRNLPTTQLSGADISVVSSGNALPLATVLGESGRTPPAERIDGSDSFSSFDPETDGIDFFESVEAMLVTVEDAVAIAPTNRFGEIFAVANGGDGASGISERGTLNISPGDFNPEKIQIDEDSGIFDFEFPEVDAGAELGDVTGVVSYGFGNFEVLPTQDFTGQIVASPLAPKVSDIAGGDSKLTIASYNVLNLDPKNEDPALTDQTDGNFGDDTDDDVGDGRFTAIAQQIVTNLNSPDIIGLQEIQNEDGTEISDIATAAGTLQLLVDEIAAAGGPRYEFIDTPDVPVTTTPDGNVDDGALIRPVGGAPGGDIRNAFLYNADRVSLVDGSVETITDDDSDAFPFLGARIPLVARFDFGGEEITVVNNHFSSKGGSAPILGIEQPFEDRQEDPTVNGSLDERQPQAQLVNDFVDGVLAQDTDANVVVLGDLNEFEFVSPLGIVAGTQGFDGANVNDTPGDRVLVNLTDNVAPDERYSFIFQGNSQQLDHILATAGLAVNSEIDIVYVNSEFAETDMRASDHDPVLASFDFAPAPASGIEQVARGGTGIFDDSSAEIVAHEGGRFFVSNAADGTIDVYERFGSDLVEVDEISNAALGGSPNSVDVRDGVVAVAIEAETATDNGTIKLFDALSLEELASFDALGALPDMLTFSRDGTQLFVAIEGEPSDDYSIDPVGGVTIIDLDSEDLANSTATFVGFEDFIGQEDALRDAGIRIFGPGANAAQDLEPEFIAEGDGELAVTLQENNALSIIDLATKTVTGIQALGAKDHGLEGNGFDSSDRDAAIAITPKPIFGLYQPDAIASYQVDGQTYYVTANEGDAREYDAFEEEVDVADVVLDPTAFPDAATLQTDEVAGRLNVTDTLGDTDGDGDFDALFTFGGRSFSIWDAEGSLVYDSGDLLERLAADFAPAQFNANNDDPFDFDNRSDNKGPEPEAVAIAEIEGRQVAILGLERQNALVFFDVTDPTAPEFLRFLNTTDPADEATGEPFLMSDLGPESIEVIPPEDSESGQLEIAVANEVSGTVSLYTVTDLLPSAPEPLEILLTNDDGFDSDGITAMRDALLAAGFTVKVVAPLEQQSGVGTAIDTDKIFAEVAIQEFRPGDFNVDGTPVTTTIAALDFLLAETPPGLVISGINEGQNIGEVAISSGTVSAAVTAILRDVPAIAVSAGVGSTGESLPETYEAAAGLVTAIVTDMQARRDAGADILPEGTGLNINVPEGWDGSDFAVTTVRGEGSIQFAFTRALETDQAILDLFGIDLSGADENDVVYGISIGAAEGNPDSEAINFEAGAATISPIDGDWSTDAATRIALAARLTDLSFEDPDEASQSLNIMVTNDDGFDSDGLGVLFEALRAAGHTVTVVAPAGPQSGQGTNLDIDSIGTLLEVQTFGPTDSDFNLDTTPIAVSRAGLQALLDEAPDLVVSGINEGQNTGLTAISSGTISAAVGALYEDVPAIAISAGIDLTEAPEFASTEIAYEIGADFLTDLIADLIDTAGGGPLLPEGVGLNVNIPTGEIAGVSITRLDEVTPLGFSFGPVSETENGLVLTFGTPNGDPLSEGSEFLEGNITVTPIDGDYTVEDETFDDVAELVTEGDAFNEFVESDGDGSFTLELLHVADQEAGATALQDAPRFSAVMNALDAQDLGDDGVADNTIRLSSGDAFIPGLFFGASEALFGAGGIADIQIQNELGLQAIALGNHEFDFGTQVLSELIDGSAGEGPRDLPEDDEDFDPNSGLFVLPEGEDFDGLSLGALEGQDFAGAQFPYLSTNLNFAPDANLAPLEVAGGAAPQPKTVTSSTVIDVNGENIGVVGATTPTLGSISNPGDVGISPSPFDLGQPTPEQLDALAAEIQAEVDALLAADPTLDKVILLAHMQQLSIEQALASRLTDVDIVVAGGSNTRLFDDNDRPRDGDSDQGQYPIEEDGDTGELNFVTGGDGNPVAVVNTDGSYKYVGRLVIDFDENGVIIPESYDPEVSGAYAADDQGVADLGAQGLIDPEIQALVDAVEAQIVATESNVFGVSDVFLNGNRQGLDTPEDTDGVRTQETNLGNLTADANLAYAQSIDESVVLSLKNGGGIRASVGQTVVPPGGTEPERSPNEEILDDDGNVIKPEGGISENDIRNVLAFNNGLTLVTLEKSEIVDLLEHGVSGLPAIPGDAEGRFPQIAGVTFSFDETLPIGDRILNAAIVDEDGTVIEPLVIDGDIAGDASQEFRIVTLGFLANPRFDDTTGDFIGGGDGYPFPNLDDPAVAARTNPVDLEQEGVRTGDAAFADDGSEQDVLAEYLDDTFNPANGGTPFDEAETGRDSDTRIQNVAFREDTIFEDGGTGEMPMFFVGTQADDTFVGGAGDDGFLLRFGADTATGNGGADEFVIDSRYVTPGDSYTITDFDTAESDTISFRFFDAPREIASEADLQFYLNNGFATVNGMDGTEMSITFENLGGNFGSSADRFVGTNADDVFDGGDGEDSFLLRLGDDTATGGADADSFIFDGRYVGSGSEHAVTDLNFDEGDALLLRFFDSGVVTVRSDEELAALDAESFANVADTSVSTLLTLENAAGESLQVELFAGAVV